MTGLNFLLAFSELSKSIGVPFVIDFDEKEDLRVTVVVKDTPARAILAGLAGSYDLRFAPSERGVIVTRRGVPRPPMPIIVGEWSPIPNVQYDVQFTLRSPAGQTVASPALTTLSGHVTTIRLGFETSSVMRFDRNHSRMETRATGGFELAFVVLREIGKELQLIAELTVEKPVSEDTYSGVRTVAKALAPSRETTLLRTPDGHELLLVSWRRSQN